MKSFAHIWAAVTILTVVAFVPAVASSDFVGDWTYGRTDDGATFYAFTTNESGSAFGEWCGLSTGKCLWMVGMNVSCDEHASTVPVLANTDSGAGAIMISCDGVLQNTNLYRYVFSSWKDVESLLTNSSRIGFAIPMQADQFRVVRFSLKGQSEAVGAMEQRLNAVLKVTPPKPDSRDATL